jgi:hypothetical protein
MESKWSNLIERLEIFNSEGQEVFCEEELRSVELEHNIVLPSDYKYFCQYLGTGMLTNSVRIYCPTSMFIEEGKAKLTYMIDRIKEYMCNDAQRDLERDQNYLSLLNSAFVFGDSSTGHHVLFWDLQSYDELDHSYDIYWADLDLPECIDPVRVGRDFFSFIQDFCYGTQMFELVPEYMEDSSQDDIKPIFHQFQLTQYTAAQLDALQAEVDAIKNDLWGI